VLEDPGTENFGIYIYSPQLPSPQTRAELGQKCISGIQAGCGKLQVKEAPKQPKETKHDQTQSYNHVILQRRKKKNMSKFQQSELH